MARSGLGRLVERLSAALFGLDLLELAEHRLGVDSQQLGGDRTIALGESQRLLENPLFDLRQGSSHPDGEDPVGRRAGRATPGRALGSREGDGALVTFGGRLI